MLEGNRKLKEVQKKTVEMLEHYDEAEEKMRLDYETTIRGLKAKIEKLEKKTNKK